MAITVSLLVFCHPLAYFELIRNHPQIHMSAWSLNKYPWTNRYIMSPPYRLSSLLSQEKLLKHSLTVHQLWSCFWLFRSFFNTWVNIKLTLSIISETRVNVFVIVLINLFNVQLLKSIHSTSDQASEEFSHVFTSKTELLDTHQSIFFFCLRKSDQGDFVVFASSTSHPFYSICEAITVLRVFQSVFSSHLCWVQLSSVLL